MRTKTIYEWDAETTATEGHPDYEPGEVIDHDHRATFAEAAAVPTTAPFETICVALVRDVWTEDGDLADRTWAYLQPDGTLPTHFRHSNDVEGERVPMRFHAEVARAALSR